MPRLRRYESAERVELYVIPTLTYLANSIRAGDRADSVFDDHRDRSRRARVGRGRGAERSSLAPSCSTSGPRRISRPPSAIRLDRLLRLGNRRTAAHADGGVPRGAHRADAWDLPPIAIWFPSIRASPTRIAWPTGIRRFPIDLKRVRPIDEEYWNRYRATPKAFIPIERGQQLWSSRHGGLTALRLIPPRRDAAGDARASNTRKRCSASSTRWRWDFPCTTCARRGSRRRAARPISASTSPTSAPSSSSRRCCSRGCSSSSASSSGCRKSGCCRRSGSIPRRFGGCLSARRLFSRASAALVGIAGAIAYSALIMLGLRTWWVDAVGTTALTLHVDPMLARRRRARGRADRRRVHLVVAARACDRVDALAARWRKGVRSLFSGSRAKRLREPFSAAIAAGALAVALLVGTALGRRAARRRLLWRRRAFARGDAVVSRRLAAPRHAGARFTATACGPCGAWDGATRRTGRREACSASPSSPSRRSSSSRSKRSSATNRTRCSIAIRAAEAIRCWSRRCCRSFTISTIAAGRDAMNLPAGGALQDVRFDRFRVRPGDDTSCLNLYQPKNPRILAATQDFINSGRFAFHSSLAEIARRTRQSLAAAQSRVRGRRRSRHHRRQLDDLRAAHEARRRLRAAGVVRAPDQAAARRGACPTASSRASC